MDFWRDFLLEVVFLACLLSSGLTAFYDEFEETRVGQCPWIKNRLKNGRVKIRSRGRIAKFICRAGYQIVGSRFATCVFGEWNNPLPICVSLGCPNMENPRNGKLTSMNSGAVLQYHCNSGYVLKGSSTIYCNGDRWNASAPTCDAATSQPSLSCDFEDPDLCGWTHDSNHDFDWKRHHFATPSGHVGTGPSYDHTFGKRKGGFYMFIEASSPRKENDTARMFSPVFSPLDSPGCFVFWYHMYGQSIGSLRVYIKPESQLFGELLPVWEKVQDQGNQWLRGAISIPAFEEPFQVIIEGIRGSSYMGDAAIDDVSLQQVDCLSAESFNASLPSEETPDSCRGRCGETETNSSCGCTHDCAENNSCCADYSKLCSKKSDKSPSDTDYPEVIPGVIATTKIPDSSPSNGGTTSTARAESTGTTQVRNSSPQPLDVTTFPGKDQSTLKETASRQPATTPTPQRATPPSSPQLNVATATTTRRAAPPVSKPSTTTTLRTTPKATTAKTTTATPPKTTQLKTTSVRSTTLRTTTTPPVTTTTAPPVPTTKVRITSPKTTTTPPVPTTIRTTTMKTTTETPVPTTIVKTTPMKTTTAPPVPTTRTLRTTTAPPVPTTRKLRTTTAPPVTTTIRMTRAPPVPSTAVTSVPTSRARITLKTTSLKTVPAIPDQPTKATVRRTSSRVYTTTALLVFSSPPTTPSTITQSAPTTIRSTMARTQPSSIYTPSSSQGSSEGSLVTTDNHVQPKSAQQGEMTSSSTEPWHANTIPDAHAVSITSPKRGTRVVRPTAAEIPDLDREEGTGTSRTQLDTNNKGVTKSRPISRKNTRKPSSSASKAITETDSLTSIVAGVTCGVIVALSLLGLLVYFIAKKRKPTQSKLSEDSEMKYLSDNEIIEYSDPSAPNI